MYASMYGPFKRTAISSRARPITSDHMAESCYAILPLLLFSIERVTNKIKPRSSQSSFLKTLHKWAEKEYLRSLRIDIHKERKNLLNPKDNWSNLISSLKSMFCIDKASFQESVSMEASTHVLLWMGDSAVKLHLMGASALQLVSLGATTTNIFRNYWWSSLVPGMSPMWKSHMVVCWQCIKLPWIPVEPSNYPSA